MDPLLPKLLSEAKLVVCAILACSLFSCSAQIYGHYDRFYPGAPLPLSKVAVLFTKVPHKDPFYYVDVRELNGEKKKLLTMIELPPGSYTLCATYYSFVSTATLNHKKVFSQECAPLDFTVEAGHTYTLDAALGESNGSGWFPLREIGKYQITSSPSPLSWHPVVEDVTNEQSARKHYIDEQVSKHRES